MADGLEPMDVEAQLGLVVGFALASLADVLVHQLGVDWPVVALPGLVVDFALVSQVVLLALQLVVAWPVVVQPGSVEPCEQEDWDALLVVVWHVEELRHVVQLDLVAQCEQEGWGERLVVASLEAVVQHDLVGSYALAALAQQPEVASDLHDQVGWVQQGALDWSEVVLAGDDH
jgi:hypothetical protein